MLETVSRGGLLSRVCLKPFHGKWELYKIDLGLSLESFHVEGVGQGVLGIVSRGGMLSRGCLEPFHGEWGCLGPFHGEGCRARVLDTVSHGRGCLGPFHGEGCRARVLDTVSQVRGVPETV